MAKAECACCLNPVEARSMVCCRGCGRVLCRECAEAGEGCCTECQK